MGVALQVASLVTTQVGKLGGVEQVPPEKLIVSVIAEGIHPPGVVAKFWKRSG